ncbi:MAG: hypothetical protein V3U60_03230 [Gammaproteobacteria bacterium]
MVVSGILGFSVAMVQKDVFIISVMAGNMESTLVRAFAMSRAHGYNFHLIIIPQDVAVGDDELAFDQAEMRAMFAAGRKLGRDPGAWGHTPPTGAKFAPWMIEVLGRLESK